MATEHWIAIGLIVATLFVAAGTTIAPSIAAVVQYKLAKKGQENVSPERLRDRLLHWARSPYLDWLPRISVLFSIYMLYQELSSKEPLTRFSALVMSIYLVNIAMNLMFAVLYRTSSKICETIRSIIEMQRKQLEISKVISDDHSRPSTISAPVDSAENKQPTSKTRKKRN